MTYASENVSAFIERFKRSAGVKKTVCRALQNLPCRHMQVIGFSKKKLPHVGIALSLSDNSVRLQINKLLAKKNLAPITEFQIQHSVAYGRYDSNNTQ